MEKSSRNRIKKILFWGCIVILPLWIFYGFYKIRSTATYNPSISLTAPKEYLDLFNEEAKAKMTLYESINVSGRQPFSEFLYDKKYSIIVYEIDSSVNMPLKNLIHIQFKSVSSNSNTVYSSFKFPGFNLSYAHDSVVSIQDILFTVDGDSINKGDENDSLINYALRLNNFSMGYGDSGKKDVFAEKEMLETKPPVELIFVKNGFRLFLLILSNIDSNVRENINFGTKLLRSGT